MTVVSFLPKSSKLPTKYDPIRKIDRLYTRGLLTLGREMERLNTLSIGNKLSSNQAKDLRDNLKLLWDMRKAHKTIKADRATQVASAATSITTDALEASTKS